MGIIDSPARIELGEALEQRPDLEVAGAGTRRDGGDIEHGLEVESAACLGRSLQDGNARPDNSADLDIGRRLRRRACRQRRGRHRQRHRLVDRGIDRDSGRPEKINAGSTSDRSNHEQRYRSHTPVPPIRGCRSYSCGNANTT